MKNCLTLLFFSLFLQTCLIAQKQDTHLDKRLVGIDTALTKLLKDWKVAGFAVAVIEKDKVLYSNGFGYRDIDTKQPVTANTLFAIGSCTKAFTATLIGNLEKEGLVSIDKKATDYLPTLRFYNDNMNNTITIRDMMSHRTGLPRHDYSWYLFTTSSRDSLLQRIKYMEPNAGIRERWQYNNFMFLLQGMIAERITGKTWEQNIKEKFFTPLEMTRSNFSVKDLQKDADASRGYGLKNDSIIKKLDYYNIEAMGPAGSINSSVTEMAHWVISWLNDGKYKGREVLPAVYMRDAVSSQMVISGGFPDKENPDIHFSNYGLGWFLSSYRGHFRVEHGGNIDGFSASTSFFPSDSIGIVVLTNQNSSNVPTIVRNMIADRMLRLKYINWNAFHRSAMDKSKQQGKIADKDKQSTKVPNTKPSHKLEEYEGLFSNEGYGALDLFVRNDSLFGRTVKDSVWLRHYHYDVFEIKGYDAQDGLDTTEGGIIANFRSNDQGKIESVLIPMEASLQPIEFKYHSKAKELSKEELQKYTGDYELNGITSTVYLKGTVLYVFVPGQPEYETVPVGNHRFNLKKLDGYSVKFEVTEKDEVTSMSFIQPNGIFKATKKK